MENLPPDRDGEAGVGELAEAAVLVVLGGGGEGEAVGVIDRAQAFVLAFADVVVGKEVHLVGFAVQGTEEGG